MPSALGTVRENIQAQRFCDPDDSTCRQIRLVNTDPPATRRRCFPLAVLTLLER